VSGAAALALIPFVVLPPAPALAVIAVSVLLHGAYKLALATLYSGAELSRAYPLARGITPLVAMALGYALLGDLVWQREGITEREERPWLQRTLADLDPNAVREGMLRMSAILARIPDLTLVPAHDLRGFAEMPQLPGSAR